MTLFEGTDLSMAYGGFSDPQIQAPPPQSLPMPPSVQQPPPPPVVQNKPVQMVSLQQPTEVSYQPPEAMYTQQPMVTPVEVGFFERMTARKYDVLKVVMFAFIILLAISMDRFFTHYLAQYISQSILTNTQELLIRASYPVAILLVIWFVKAM